MKRVSLFLGMVVLAAVFASCKTGTVVVRNNSSMKADGGIALYDNTDKMEVFLELTPGSSQNFSLKAGKRYVVVAWKSDDSSIDLVASPQILTVIADQTQTVQITDPAP